jgi:hypothetical protein
MKRQIIFCLLVFFGLSCSDADQLPKGVLGAKKMGDVMTDIALAESYIENYYEKKANGPRDSAIGREVDKVLAMHEVSQETFRQSYQFYKSRPDIFRVILDTVFAENQRYQDKLHRKIKPAPPTGTQAPLIGKPVPVQ